MVGDREARGFEGIDPERVQRREVDATLGSEFGFARPELVARAERRRHEAFLTGFFLLIDSIL